MNVVVSDTSPIRAFAFIGRLDILESLFDEILVPPTVFSELTHPTRWGPPVLVSSIPWIVVRAPQRTELVAAWRRELDLGEAESLAVAQELPGTTLLIDEKAGRAAATRAGLPVIGTLGVLTRAKRQGLVPEVTPLMDRLRFEFDFFVSDQLRQEIQRQSGE
jgi:hypothetical protein